MEKEGILSLFTAFSRDQDDKMWVHQLFIYTNHQLNIFRFLFFPPCSYVQHRIAENSEHLKFQILEKNGYFFVAGSSKDMPTAVKEALSTAIGDKDYVEQMIKTGRYQEETWA